MIVRCPNCGTRYRVQDTRIRERSLVLRCGRCHKRFKPSDPEPERAVAGPQREATAAAASPPESKDVPKKQVGGASQSILIADEARSFSDRISAFFRNTGAKVITARDGDEAWEIARKEKDADHG